MIECLLSTVHLAGNLVFSGFLRLDAQQKPYISKAPCEASMAASLASGNIPPIIDDHFMPVMEQVHNMRNLSAQASPVVHNLAASVMNSYSSDFFLSDATDSHIQIHFTRCSKKLLQWCCSNSGTVRSRPSTESSEIITIRRLIKSASGGTLRKGAQIWQIKIAHSKLDQLNRSMARTKFTKVSQQSHNRKGSCLHFNSSTSAATSARKTVFNRLSYNHKVSVLATTGNKFHLNRLMLHFKHELPCLN